MKTVIFDIDGTLADVEHRRHHVAHKPKRWDLFFSELSNDPPVKDVVRLHDLLIDYNFLLNQDGEKPRVKLVFCTGRGEEYRDVTTAWLIDNLCISFSAEIDLRMRPANDSRPDDIIKKEMLDQLRAEQHDIWFVVDDRQRVVDMWRANGVTVFQCAPGDFDTAPDEYKHDWEADSCALTLMVGPSGAGKSTYLARMRPEMIISSDDARRQMFGNAQSREDNERVFSYVHALAKTRMQHGLGVIIDATHLSRKDRLASVALAPPGTGVSYIIIDRPLADKMRDGGWRLDVKIDGMTLVEKHHQRMQGSIKDILRGDGLPNVIAFDHRTK